MLGFLVLHVTHYLVLQWSILPLADNYHSDDFLYLLRVHTGLWWASGTRSKVMICLDGELASSGVRELTDGVRCVSLVYLSLVYLSSIIPPTPIYRKRLCVQLCASPRSG